MALYIRHSIFHMARLLYARPETFGPYYVMYATCFGMYSGMSTQKQYKGRYNFFFIFYFPLYGFCVDMPEEGLSTGRNMKRTCEGNQLN